MSKVLQGLAVLPVRIVPPHTSPEEAHVFLPQALLPWCFPEPAWGSNGAHCVLERRENQRELRLQAQPCTTPPAPSLLATNSKRTAAKTIPAMSKGNTMPKQREQIDPEQHDRRHLCSLNNIIACDRFATFFAVTVNVTAAVADVSAVV